MNRRKFFGTLVGGVAAGAAVRTWPFRVFSFPAQVKPVTGVLTPEMLRRALEILKESYAREHTVERQLIETYATYGIAYWNGRPQPKWDSLSRFYPKSA